LPQYGSLAQITAGGLRLGLPHAPLTTDAPWRSRCYSSRHVGRLAKHCGISGIALLGLWLSDVALLQCGVSTEAAAALASSSTWVATQALAGVAHGFPLPAFAGLAAEHGGSNGGRAHSSPRCCRGATGVCTAKKATQVAEIAACW